MAGGSVIRTTITEVTHFYLREAYSAEAHIPRNWNERVITYRNMHKSQGESMPGSTATKAFLGLTQA